MKKKTNKPETAAKQTATRRYYLVDAEIVESNFPDDLEIMLKDGGVIKDPGAGEYLAKNIVEYYRAYREYCNNIPLDDDSNSITVSDLVDFIHTQFTANDIHQYKVPYFGDGSEEIVPAHRVQDYNQAVSLINTVIKSCEEGKDGRWDCSTKDGKEGFDDMIELLERAKGLFK